MKVVFLPIKGIVNFEITIIITNQDLAHVGMANTKEIYCSSVLTLAQIFFLCFILIPSHLTILFLRAEQLQVSVFEYACHSGEYQDLWTT